MCKYITYVNILALMDNIFNKKPWIKPLAVAGTSIETSDESSESSCSTEESLKKSKYE